MPGEIGTRHRSSTNLRVQDTVSPDCMLHTVYCIQLEDSPSSLVFFFVLMVSSVFFFSACFFLFGFLTSSSTTRVYRGRVQRLTSDNFTCCHTRDSLQSGLSIILGQGLTGKQRNDRYITGTAAFINTVSISPWSYNVAIYMSAHYFIASCKALSNEADNLLAYTAKVMSSPVSLSCLLSYTV